MNWTLLMICVAGAILIAGTGDPTTKAEIEKMQGTWLVVKQVADGRDASQKELADADIKLIVKDLSYTVIFGGKKLTEGKLNVVASKSPTQLDATDSDGPLKGQARPAIYKFENNLWIVNFGKAGQVRPTDFTSKEGSNRLMLTYQKVK